MVTIGACDRPTLRYRRCLKVFELYVNARSARDVVDKRIRSIINRSGSQRIVPRCRPLQNPFLESDYRLRMYDAIADCFNPLLHDYLSRGTLTLEALP